MAGQVALKIHAHPCGPGDRLLLQLLHAGEELQRAAAPWESLLIASMDQLMNPDGAVSAALLFMGWQPLRQRRRYSLNGSEETGAR
jgi:hypothetical protein